MKRFKYVSWETRHRRRLASAPYYEALEECRTASDLRLMARLRNYKNGWVNHVIEARQRAKRERSVER